MRGIKKFETRSWQTQYRGKILITSSVRAYPDGQYLEYLLCQKHVLDPEPHNRLPTQLLGLALGTVDLVEILPTSDDGLEYKPIYYSMTKEAFQLENTVGDFGVNRFAWKLANPVEFKDPFWIRGNRMLFTLSPINRVGFRELLHERGVDIL